MSHKKSMSAVFIALGLVASIVTPAYAHGHHRQRIQADTSCPVCPYEDCAETGRHTHEGTNYCGYDHESGYCDESCVNADYSGYGCGGYHGCHR